LINGVIILYTPSYIKLKLNQTKLRPG